jgi:putative ribosome biogenesis GTPase RsgA
MTRDDFLKQLPELVRTYTPASDVANHIKNLDLLMIIGPSGVGKTAIINRLELKYIVSDEVDQNRESDARLLAESLLGNVGYNKVLA